MQLAAAVGVPVKRGQITKLAGLGRAGGSEAVLVLPCPSCTFAGRGRSGT